MAAGNFDTQGKALVILVTQNSESQYICSRLDYFVILGCWDIWEEKLLLTLLLSLSLAVFPALSPTGAWTMYNAAAQRRTSGIARQGETVVIVNVTTMRQLELVAIRWKVNIGITVGNNYPQENLGLKAIRLSS